jgi:O-Antigen ligase.
MQMVTTRHIVPYVATIAPLALTVVLPPKYLAAYILVLGAIGFIWGMFYRRDMLFKPTILAITVPLALAGLFCLLGTLPITQQSDIQLEFLKYAIYAAAFLLGLLVLNNDWKRHAFILTVIVIVCMFFVVTALNSGQRFGINQSWPLYPPDQNNTSSILAPFAVFVLAFRPRWLKVAIFLLLFLFFIFAESRFGIILLFAIAFVDFVRDWRSGLTVLAIAGLISGLFSLSSVSVQTTVMRGIAAFTAPAQQPSSQVSVNPQVPQNSAASQASPNEAIRQESAQPTQARVSTSPMVQFGTWSDNARLQVYARAFEIAVRIFPNLIGLGDAEVTMLLNTPPIDSHNTFQHAHNFFLQGYLAYGLLATAALVTASIGILVVGVRQRDWYLTGAMLMIGAYGMIESLISDLRVLTIVMLLLGSSVAVTLQTDRVKKDPKQP